MEQKLDMVGGGWLTMRWDERRVAMEARRPADGRGLYKVWLHGRQGSEMLLGTLVPEGNVLRLSRTLLRSELEQAGCWPPERAEARLTFSFSQGTGWYREPHPERFVREAYLRRQLNGAMLCRREGEGVCLAAPFRTDAPMLMPSLFCLVRIEALDGKHHLLWRFDRNGYPRTLYPTGEKKKFKAGAEEK